MSRLYGNDNINIRILEIYGASVSSPLAIIFKNRSYRRKFPMI